MNDLENFSHDMVIVLTVLPYQISLNITFTRAFTLLVPYLNPITKHDSIAYSTCLRNLFLYYARMELYFNSKLLPQRCLYKVIDQLVVYTMTGVVLVK